MALSRSKSVSLSGSVAKAGKISDTQKQLNLILKNNPAPNDTLTWIRTIKDIVNPKKAFSEDEFGGAPDWTYSDAQKALKTGKVTVYSSYQIKNGTFVSPSKMEAESYGGGKVFKMTVPISDVAWIDDIQGQYAKIK